MMHFRVAQHANWGIPKLTKFRKIDYIHPLSKVKITNMTTTSKKHYALLAAIAANFIWGMGGFTIKIAVDEIGVNNYIAARFFLVTVLLLPWAIKYFPKQLSFKKWMLLLFVGILAGPANYFLVVNGLGATNLSSASFILLAEPLIAFSLAGILLKERITKKMKLGLSVALSGALIITIGSAGLDIAGVSLIGNMLIVGVIALSALDLVLSKKIMKDVSPRFLLWLMSFLTSLFIYPFVMPQQAADIVMSATLATQLSIAWGVIMNTMIAYYCYYFAIKALKAGEAGMFRYVDPVVGVLVGFLLLGEQFSTLYIAGGLLVASGIYLTESSVKKFHVKHFWRRHHHHHRRHHQILHRS